MSESRSEAQRRERNKNIAGLVLGLLVFGWFLFYLISHVKG